jgi:hypothetical protein
MNFPMGVRTALKMTARSMVAAPSDLLGRNHKYKRRAKRGQFCGRPAIARSWCSENPNAIFRCIIAWKIRRNERRTATEERYGA